MFAADVRPGDDLILRYDSTGVDPGTENGDVSGTEPRPFLRHGDDALGAGDGLDEQAVRAVAGQDGRTVVAAFADAGGTVEAQAVALHLRPMAADAVLREDRFDLTVVIHWFGRNR